MCGPASVLGTLAQYGHTGTELAPTDLPALVDAWEGMRGRDCSVRRRPRRLAKLGHWRGGSADQSSARTIAIRGHCPMPRARSSARIAPNSGVRRVSSTISKPSRS